jgi:purine nucleosidase
VARPVVIDTDGGVDDAVALWWALRDPALDVRAITVVWGNVPVEIAGESVLRVVHAAGRADVPVALGEAGPIGPAPDLRPATFIHGDDGLGNAAGPRAPLAAVADDAPSLLASVVRDAPGEVAVVTLGPLTNLARAIRNDAQLADDIDELIVMGGSARRGGNALPAGEANVAHDPIAAHEVVLAPWRVPPLMVGLDVTLTATLSDAEFALLAEHVPRSPRRTCARRSADHHRRA